MLREGDSNPSKGGHPSHDSYRPHHHVTWCRGHSRLSFREKTRPGADFREITPWKVNRTQRGRRSSRVGRSVNGYAVRSHWMQQPIDFESLIWFLANQLTLRVKGWDNRIAEE